MVGPEIAPLTASVPVMEAPPDVRVMLGAVVMFQDVPTIITLPWPDVNVREFVSAVTLDCRVVMVGLAMDPVTFSEPVRLMPRDVKVAFVYAVGAPDGPTTIAVPCGLPTKFTSPLRVVTEFWRAVMVGLDNEPLAFTNPAIVNPADVRDAFVADDATPVDHRTNTSPVVPELPVDPVMASI